MGDYYQMPKQKQTQKTSSKAASNSYYREDSFHGSIQKQSVNIRSTAVGVTEYICLTNEDLIYNGNLHRCGSPDFQFILRKITKDLNLLLHFKYDEFWMQLTSSQSLKKCLRSCLQVLPRKHFGQYLMKSKQKVEELNFQTLEKEIFEVLKVLMRSVLFIYYRIICESNATEKVIVYNEWLLDIPKIFNLIGIYKHSNQKILKEILNTAFTKILDYRDDVVDFVRIMGTSMLNSLAMDLDYEYTQKIITNSKNFNNPLLSFTRNLIKSFFRVFDVYVTMIDFITYFPIRYVMMLIGEPDLLLEYIYLYFRYMENITGRWEFTPDFTNRFKGSIEIIRQKMLEFIIRSMDFLDNILAQHVQTQLWSNCLMVYFTLCKEFQCRDQSPGNRWETLIHIVISQTPHRQIFRLEPHFSPKLNQKELKIIKKCREYQKEYRNELSRKNFHDEEILELKLSQIKSFKEWNDFENFKSFDLMVEDEFHEDLTIKDDSILMQLESQIHQAQFQKKHPHAPPSQAHLAKRRKPRTFPFFEQEQYNDEPPLEEDQGEAYGFVCGREPMEDVENELQFLQDGQDGQQNQQNRKKTVQYFKKKKQIETYAKYYNASNEANNKKTGKKTYVPLDDLTIGYQTQQVKNLKIEKIEHKPSGSTFKKKQENPVKKQKQIMDVRDLSVSAISSNNDTVNGNELQNLMDEIDASDLSISIDFSLPDKQRKQTNLLDISTSNKYKDDEDELIQRQNGSSLRKKQQKSSHFQNNSKNQRSRNNNERNNRNRPKQSKYREDDSNDNEVKETTEQLNLSLSFIENKQVEDKKKGSDNNKSKQSTTKKVFNEQW